MMQVKIFSGSKLDVEERINDWFEKHYDEMVLDSIKQTESISIGKNRYGSTEIESFTISIFYEL